MDETNAMAQEVRGTLEAMQSAIQSLGLFGDSESHNMLTVHFTLVTKFTDLLSECVVYNCNLLNPNPLRRLQWAACCLGLCGVGTYKCRKMPKFRKTWMRPRYWHQSLVRHITNCWPMPLPSTFSPSFRAMVAVTEVSFSGDFAQGN